ncbi:hypothetical protein D9M71_803810 [compost metagenome]
MLDMLEAKLPPPKPQSKAIHTNTLYGVPGSCTAKPIQIDGTSNDAVLRAVQRRPPKIGTIKE